jgi:hypothetical protein
MMCVPSFAVADEPFTAAKMEKLGKLAGQLSLHANVLKNLDTLCYPNKPETNYTASLDSDIKAMPENTQEIMVLQTSTVNNLAAIVANGIIKKANGCETNDFKNAYLQVEDMYQNALLNWFQKNI